MPDPTFDEVVKEITKLDPKLLNQLDTLLELLDPEVVTINKQTVDDVVAQIDAELSEVTTNWRLDRLGHIERSVLRLAAAELMQGGTPPRVVIQECVRLAERFGSAHSARFVNGVIDALARRMGRLT